MVPEAVASGMAVLVVAGVLFDWAWTPEAIAIMTGMRMAPHVAATQARR
jgi:hypothetical protein